MSVLELLVIAVGLAMDAFAVSLGAGATEHSRGFRAKFRLSFHFGLFQGLMTFLGWLLGAGTARWMTSFDHWVAFGLLAFVGGRMAWEGLHPDDEKSATNPSRGLMLMSLCVATSLDALAVGVTLGLLHTPVMVPCLIIGVVTAAISLAGIKIGRVLGAAFGQKMEIAGGVLLIGIGTQILIQGLRAA